MRRTFYSAADLAPRAGEVEYVGWNDGVDGPRERACKGILGDEYKAPEKLIAVRWEPEKDEWTIVREGDAMVDEGKNKKARNECTSKSQLLSSIMKPSRIVKKLMGKKDEMEAGQKEENVMYVPWNGNIDERREKRLSVFLFDMYTPPAKFVGYYRDEWDENWVLLREGECLPRRKELERSDEARAAQRTGLGTMLWNKLGVRCGRQRQTAAKC